ncbi:MAG TPA: hypothetical protein VMV86_04710 [Methanosarcinales archaeon]|nr:hypothetical protein [Methanosarcinales archaeon]
MYRAIKDYTFLDAIELFVQGYAVVIGDGKIQTITNLGEEE